jgi:hypothetical protein
MSLTRDSIEIGTEIPPPCERPPISVRSRN